MAKHAKDTSGQPQTTAEAPWHCGCGFSTTNTDLMAAHVETCRG